MAKSKKEKGKKGKKDADIIPLLPGNSEESESEIQYEHKEIRKAVLNLKDKAEESYWDLSVALFDVHEHAYYQAWGYEHWKDYVDQEVGWNIRKVEFLLKLQKKFVDLPPNVVAWVKGLGWTKARMVISRITPENVAEWRARIEGKTVAEIEKLLREMSESGEGGGGGDGGDGDAEEKPGRIVIAGVYPAQRKNIDAAFEQAKVVAQSDKKGHLLDCICTEFLSSQMATKDAREYYRSVERFTGSRILVYDPEEDKIVYGFSLIEEMEAKEAAGEVDTEVVEEEAESTEQ
jgi:hypothetical protein